LSVYNREAFNAGSDAVCFPCQSKWFANVQSYAAQHRPDNSGQAETIKQSGLQCIMENCKFRSYQDTHCLNGQLYVKDCYIEGDTDYVWGTARPILTSAS
jgi:pectin methylesterase-like acyl-CoA thioesterase